MDIVVILIYYNFFLLEWRVWFFWHQINLIPDCAIVFYHLRCQHILYISICLFLRTLAQAGPRITMNNLDVFPHIVKLSYIQVYEFTVIIWLQNSWTSWITISNSSLFDWIIIIIGIGTILFLIPTGFINLFFSIYH